MNPHSVSIIIPSLNSPLIGQTVNSLLSQQAAEAIAEIIVVGRDEPRLIPADPRVTFIDTLSPISAPRARNIGIRQAKCDTLVFIDSDCIAEPAWLERLLAAHGEEHLIVGGSVLFDNDSYWATAYNVSMFHEFLPSRSPGFRPHLPTLNLLVARQVIDAVGLFDETLRRGQDTDWTSRMTERGYRPYFEPTAGVLHRHARRSARAVLELWRQSGSYSLLIRQRHPGVLAAPKLLNYPVLLLLLSPLIALLNTGRIFAQDPVLWRRLHVFPAVYLTKIAWCLGAASAKRAAQA